MQKESDRTNNYSGSGIQTCEALSPHDILCFIHNVVVHELLSKQT